MMIFSNMLRLGNPLSQRHLPNEWGEEEFYFTAKERNTAEKFYLIIANVETETRDITISKWESNR